MRDCERCHATPSGGQLDLHDYCAKCSKNLCERCMANGCCGDVPARSGSGDDDLAEDDGRASEEDPDPRKRSRTVQHVAGDYGIGELAPAGWSVFEWDGQRWNEHRRGGYSSKREAIEAAERFSRRAEAAAILADPDARDLTRDEALEQARARWGKNAFVRGPKEPGQRGLYSVGSGTCDHRFGEGESFRHALLAADVAEREHAKRAAEREVPEPPEPDDGSACLGCGVELTDDNAPVMGSLCHGCGGAS